MSYSRSSGNSHFNIIPINDSHQRLYDCLYLALAETIDGAVITTDRKFFQALSNGP